MTMSGNLVDLNGLLGGSRLFDIPVYQRSYAWEKKNLQDIWEDLYYLDASKDHYFGTALLKDSGNTTEEGFNEFKRFDIIDGQQRLTTVLILLREIISKAKIHVDGDKGFEEGLSNLEKKYLKTSGGNYKLNPPGEDGKFFHNFIVDKSNFVKIRLQHVLSVVWWKPETSSGKDSKKRTSAPRMDSSNFLKY